eukprot:scaffold733_cov267-Pinguiococcus_pyrenoidosus.AAC.21
MGSVGQIRRLLIATRREDDLLCVYDPNERSPALKGPAGLATPLRRRGVVVVCRWHHLHHDPPEPSLDALNPSGLASAEHLAVAGRPDFLHHRLRHLSKKAPDERQGPLVIAILPQERRRFEASAGDPLRRTQVFPIPKDAGGELPRPRVGLHDIVSEVAAAKVRGRPLI